LVLCQAVRNHIFCLYHVRQIESFQYWDCARDRQKLLGTMSSSYTPCQGVRLQPLGTVRTSWHSIKEFDMLIGIISSNYRQNQNHILSQPVSLTRTGWHSSKELETSPSSWTETIEHCVKRLARPGSFGNHIKYIQRCPLILCQAVRPGPFGTCQACGIRSVPCTQKPFCTESGS